MLSCFAADASADDWLGRDKALHFSVSYGLGAAAYGGLWLIADDPPAARLLLGTGLALLPGLAKETYDAGQPGNAFSGRDMVWNVAGAVAGALTLYAIEHLTRRRAPRNERTASMASVEAGVLQLRW